MRKLTALGKEF